MYTLPNDLNEQPANRRLRRQLSSVGGWRASVWLVLLAGGPMSLQAVEAVATAPSNTVLRLGFSSSLFAGVNENDAKAAMKVWAQAILTEHRVGIIAEAKVLNGGEEITSAVRDKLVDTVTLSVEEYCALGRELLCTNAIFGVSAGALTEEYLLLVHHDSNLGRIDDLRGHSLVLFENARAALAPVWLETLLLKSGLGQTHRFCGRVMQATKLSQVVLPVFFRQADACVVTRRGFQTMVELNPQVGQQLRTLVASPALIPSAFLFRADYTDPTKEVILGETGKVHSTAGGQQILTLFQCENLELHSVSVLDPSVELVATHRRLCAVTNTASNAGPGTALDVTRTEGGK
jgi:ABC-type phosphate/phosphonate transport system substrate-binding protein